MKVQIIETATFWGWKYGKTAAERAELKNKKSGVYRTLRPGDVAEVDQKDWEILQQQGKAKKYNPKVVNLDLLDDAMKKKIAAERATSKESLAGLSDEVRQLKQQVKDASRESTQRAKTAEQEIAQLRKDLAKKESENAQLQANLRVAESVQNR